jgi:hypothetical protein
MRKLLRDIDGKVVAVERDFRYIGCTKMDWFDVV